MQPKKIALQEIAAVIRKVLTIEMSFMTYVSASLVLIAAGAALVKFFDGNPIFQVFGWAFVGIGGWLVMHGYRRFVALNLALQTIRSKYTK